MNLNNLKTLHQVTDYNFKTPKPNQALTSLAAGWADSHQNVALLKYILENGGDLDERDYSENWNEWSHYPEYQPFIKKDSDGKYYITARGLLAATNNIRYQPIKALLS